MSSDFLTALKNTNDIVGALNESGMSPKDYQTLYNCDEHFRKNVDSVLTGKSICLDGRIREMGQRKLLDLLEQGQTVRRIKRRMRYGPDGELLFTDVTTESLESGAPEWAIRTALQRTEIEDALTVLASESLLPTDTVRAVMSQLSKSRQDIHTILGGARETASDTNSAILEAQAALLGISPQQLKHA